MDGEQAHTQVAMTRVSSEASISCSNHEVAGLDTLFSMPASCLGGQPTLSL